MSGEHPADRRIRELVAGEAVRVGDLQRLRDHAANAPFSHQLRRTSVDERGLSYLGRVVQNCDDSAFQHLVRRVVKEKQWDDGTTMTEYLDDLRHVVRDPNSGVAVYDSGRGPVAVFLGLNEIPDTRRGSNARAFVFVVYAADRRCIITGYQASGREFVMIPKEA